jgi:hypothetical protein
MSQEQEFGLLTLHALPDDGTDWLARSAAQSAAWGFKWSRFVTETQCEFVGRMQ